VHNSGAMLITAVNERPPSDPIQRQGAGDEGSPKALSVGENVATQDNSSSHNRLEQVIVTAQKRDERLQDVPVPVTAIDTDTLVQNGQVRLKDYYSTVPGLNLTSSGRGDATVSIRGLTTGRGTNPTVAVLVDDVSYGGTTALASTNDVSVPDIDPSDLARVEVLRGPQGTLYGASSIGGLMKFVTVDPSTEAFSGRLQADTTSIKNGENVGYGFRGAVNVPLTSNFAVRASAYTRRDEGYIDDVSLGLRGVNQVEVDGGRASALWQITPKVSLKLSAALQNTSGDGLSSVTPGFGDLEQSFVIRDGNAFSRDARVYNATLRAELAGVSLVSISGYSVQDDALNIDLSRGLGFVADDVFGVPGAMLVVNNEIKKFTQEVRASGVIGEKVDWLLGGFYADEKTTTNQDFLAVDPGTSAVAGVLYTDPYPVTYSEYAAFGDVTVHATDRFDIQIGARESRNHQTYTEAVAGPFFTFLGLPSPIVFPLVRTEDSSFTYLVTPQFKLSPDLMLYARVASGYRPGGPNTGLRGQTFGGYKPDKTINYEIGTKGNFAAGRLSFDASVFYIDWKDIQLTSIDPVTFGVFYANAGKAKSQGVELSVEVKPFDRTTIAAWAAWTDATLTEDVPPGSFIVGASDDRLPYSSRVSGNISIDQGFPITNGVVGFAGAMVSYVGDREGDFPNIFSTTPRPTLDSYVRTDLHVGARYGSWTFNLFANNVTDRRGVVFIEEANSSINYIQPRTVGISLARSF